MKQIKRDEQLEDMLFNIPILNYINQRLGTHQPNTYPLKYSYMCSNDIVEFYNLALEYKIQQDKKINNLYKTIRGKQ